MIVEPGAVVGRTASVLLDVEKGADLSFDVLWWLDEERTEPGLMSEAIAQVRDAVDDSLILDLSPTVEDNRIMVRVGASETRAILTHGFAVWDLVVTASPSGEIKKLAKGPARIFEEVSK